MTSSTIEAQANERLHVYVRLLWRIGGADPDVLMNCPRHEWTKFTLTGTFNIIIALAMGWATWWRGSGSLFSSVSFVLIVSSIIAFLVFSVTLILLSVACRILGRSRDDGRILGSSLFPVFLLIAPVAVGLAFLSTAVFNAGSDFELFLIIMLPQWMLIMPGVLIRYLVSPTYDGLFLVLTDKEGTQFREEFNERSNSKIHILTNASESLQEDFYHEKELEILFEQNQNNVGIARRLIALRRGLQRYEQAAQVYDALISRDPENADLIKEKAALYREMGDESRYRKTLEEVDRIQAKASFEHNLGKAIVLLTMEVRDLDFFGNFKWEFQPKVNVLLGRNGYGKSHILRALVAMIQNEEDVCRQFFKNSHSRPMIQVDVEKEGVPESTIRTSLVFERSFGKAPVLAIPDMRYIDKSKNSVGAAYEEVTDLRSQSAWHFMQQTSYEGVINKFVYDLCLDYLDHGKTFQSPVFRLIENTMGKLTNNTFKFHEVIRRDNARFEIQVLTDGNTHPLPLQKASQGTLSVLAIVGLIYRYLQAIYKDAPVTEILKQQAIIVLDEIDAHLHPSWQQKILQLLCDTFPNVQFIVTAHSPLVVAGRRKHEVATLGKTSEGFVVKVLEEHFIGATFKDLYDYIFEVEEKDDTYVKLNTLYSGKSENEKAITELQNADQLSRQQADKLEALLDEQYYLQEFEEVKAKRQKKEDLEKENRQLEMEGKRLRGEVSELKNQLTLSDKGESKGEMQNAIEIFIDLCQNNPEHAAPIEAFAKFLSERGQIGSSIAVLEALIKVQPKNIDYLKELAIQYQSLEEYGKAAMVVRKALGLTPEDEQLRSVLDRLDKIVNVNNAIGRK